MWSNTIFSLSCRLLVLLCSAAFLSLSACAPLPPYFNKMFFMQSDPEKPAKSIEIPDDIAMHFISKIQILFKSSIAAKRAVLYWPSNESIIIAVLDNTSFEDDELEEGVVVEKAFFLSLTTGQFSIADTATKGKINTEINNMATIGTAETLSGKLIKGVISALTHGKLASEDVFLAQIQRDGVTAYLTINADYKVIEHKSSGGLLGALLNTPDYVLKEVSYTGSIAGSNREFYGSYKFLDGSSSYDSSFESKYINDSVHALYRWLRTWHVSPDGRVIIMADVMNTDLYDIYFSGSKKPMPFMYNYPMDSFGINPRWDTIAILRNKLVKTADGKETLKFWVEFHPLTLYK